MISDNLKKRIITSLILFLLLFLIFFYDPIFIYSLIIIGIFSALEFFNLINRICKRLVSRIMFSILFTIYLFIYCFLFFILSKFVYLKIILFALLLSCVASDIGGYIFGKIFKGPKFSKISPNKTISGSVGSVIFCTTTFTSLIYIMTDSFGTVFLITGLITSIFCQLGDLFFSYLKRLAKLKDTGSFLPGHGGFLDRIDGILLGVPLGYIVIVLALFK